MALTNISLDLQSVILPLETLIIWIVAIELVAILIVVFNLGTILTFAMNRNLCRRSMYCLINLAVADMLYGLSVIPYAAAYQQLGLKSTTHFVLMLFMELMFLASLLSLVGVPLERACATFFPFRYRTVKGHVFVIAFAIVWLISLFLVLPYHISSFYGYGSWMYPYVFFICDLVLLGLIIFSYTTIFIKIKLQNRHVHRRRGIQHQEAVALTQKRERHTGKTLFFVTILSLATWLPYIIFELVQLSYPDLSPGFIVRIVVELIQLTNSLLNPIVCLFRMKDFRKAFLKLICRCSSGRQRIHPSGDDNPVQDQQRPYMELRFRN